MYLYNEICVDLNMYLIYKICNKGYLFFGFKLIINIILE